MKAKNVLVIPDAHAHPDYDNKRFAKLGQHVEQHRPDIVVCLGDWADMPSLCKHSSRKALESRRYQADVRAAVKAQQLFFEQISNQEEIAFHMCLGNHEARIDSAIAEDPILEGKICMDDLMFEEYGWKVTRYKDILQVQGFHFSHHFSSGLMGRPIGGENQGRSLLNKKKMSCVAGHSHVFDHSMAHDGMGNPMHGIAAGCMSHRKHVEGWNSNTHQQWWRGVIWLLNAAGGDATVEAVRAEDL